MAHSSILRSAARAWFFRTDRTARREPTRINERITRKGIRSLRRLAVAFLGLAAALATAITASIHIEPAELYPSQSKVEGEVLVSSTSAASSSREQVSQLSLRPSFAYLDRVQTIEARTSVDLVQFTSATHTFAPKGELGHEYWRAMSGASKVSERYERYLHRHPSGILVDIATERIMDLSRGPD